MGLDQSEVIVQLITQQYTQQPYCPFFEPDVNCGKTPSDPAMTVKSESVKFGELFKSPKAFSDFQFLLSPRSSSSDNSIFEIVFTFSLAFAWGLWELFLHFSGHFYCSATFYSNPFEIFKTDVKNVENPQRSSWIVLQ